MLEVSFVESRHEDVQIGLQRPQVVERVLVDFPDHGRIEVVGVDVLWPDRKDSIGHGDVHVRSLLDDAVKDFLSFFEGSTSD